MDRLDNYLRELQKEDERRTSKFQPAPPPWPSPMSGNGGGQQASQRGLTLSPPPLFDTGEGQGGGAEERLTELQSGLARAGLQPAEAIPLIAPLLHLPLSPKYSPSALSPEQQRRRLLATLVDWLIGAAHAQPLVIVIEDLHWADPSTLELIQLLAEQGAAARLLLLYTARPEFRAQWPLRAHHTQITLNRLSARNVREMIAQVAARIALADETVDTVVERASGVPLFVEELTRAVLESGNTKLTGREIPVTLHDSLMARLDRLGSAKEILQLGSVIGGEFSYELLHAVHPVSDGELQGELRRLIDAELLYERGLAPDATYQFKHALIRDAAYEALLKSRRKELHRLVAHTIQEKFPDLKDAHPEVLARHWTEAGEVEPALAEWLRAGKGAESRNAFREALESYHHALAVLNLLPQSPERDLRELQLMQCVILMLWITRGHSAPESIEANQRAATLAEKSGNLSQLGIWVMARCLGAFGSGDLPTAGMLADQAFDLAVREGSAFSLAGVHALQILTRFWRGDLAGVEQRFEAGLKFFDDAGFRQLPSGGAAAAFAYASWNAWMLGRADVARERIAQMATTIGNNLFEVALSRSLGAHLRVLLREYEQAEALAAQGVELCERNQILQIAGNCRCVLGHARAQLGRTTDGIVLIRQAIDGMLEFGPCFPGITPYTTFLAEAQQRSGAIAEALETVEQTLQANPGELVYRPESLRIRGELRLKQEQTELAERDFRESIALATNMSAKAWELRSTMSLARLLDQEGRRDEARTMLAEIFNWFTEGLDTPDLKDAKTLLNELGT